MDNNNYKIQDYGAIKGKSWRSLDLTQNSYQFTQTHLNINNTLLHTSNTFNSSNWNSNLTPTTNQNSNQLLAPNSLSASSTQSSSLNVPVYTYHRHDFKNRRSSSEPVQDQLTIQNSLLSSQKSASKDAICQSAPVTSPFLIGISPSNSTVSAGAPPLATCETCDDGGTTTTGGVSQLNEKSRDDISETNSNFIECLQNIPVVKVRFSERTCLKKTPSSAYFVECFIKLFYDKICVLISFIYLIGQKLLFIYMTNCFYF